MERGSFFFFCSLGVVCVFGLCGVYQTLELHTVLVPLNDSY